MPEAATRKRAPAKPAKAAQRRNAAKPPAKKTDPEVEQRKQEIADAAIAPPQPWEKQPTETVIAFNAFKDYRDAGVDRSLRKTAAATDHPLSTIAEWSKNTGWVRRVEEFEVHADSQHLEWMRTERRNMARRHARMAGAIQAKMVDAIQRLDPEKMTTAQLLQALDITTKVERQAVGEIQRLEHSGPGGGPIEIGLPEDELAMMAELQAIGAALSERLGGDGQAAGS